MANNDNNLTVEEDDVVLLYKSETYTTPSTPETIVIDVDPPKTPKKTRAMKLETDVANFLIEEVHNRTLIWDLADDDHTNNLKTKQAWEAIYEKMLATFGKRKMERNDMFKAINVKKRWVNLRDTYVRKAKEDAGMSGDAADAVSRWVYGRAMSFLSDRHHNQANRTSFPDVDATLSATQDNNEQNNDDTEQNNVNNEQNNDNNEQNNDNNEQNNDNNEQNNDNNEQNNVNIEQNDNVNTQQSVSDPQPSQSSNNAEHQSQQRVVDEDDDFFIDLQQTQDWPEAGNAATATSSRGTGAQKRGKGKRNPGKTCGKGRKRARVANNNDVQQSSQTSEEQMRSTLQDVMVKQDRLDSFCDYLACELRDMDEKARDECETATRPTPTSTASSVCSTSNHSCKTSSSRSSSSSS